MLSKQKLKAFIPTTKPAEAKQFYQNILGLKIVFENAYAMELEGKESLLMINTIKSFTPQPFTVLGWNVGDVASEVRTLNEQGVEFERYDGFDQDDLGVWVSPSKAKVVWFKDPDGNLLSLTELPK